MIYRDVKPVVVGTVGPALQPGSTVTPISMSALSLCA